jgi:hypothetical protein
MLRKVRMRRLTKSGAIPGGTGRARAPPADIDDVVASEQLAFKPFAGADVDVRRNQAARAGAQSRAGGRDRSRGFAAKALCYYY